MKKKLVMVSFSGIQEYISQAKSTGDLWAGSRIVEDLVNATRKKVLNCIEKENIGKVSSETVAQNDQPGTADFFQIGLETEKSPEQLEKDILRFIEKNSGAFPEEIECFVAAVEEDQAEAYQKVYDRIQASKNHRFEFREALRRTLSENAENMDFLICEVCGKRPQDKKQTEPRDEKRCKQCGDKHQRYKQEGKFPSTLDIARMGAEKSRKYYALIQMDLDDMGIHMSEEKTDKKKEGDLSERVQKFLEGIREAVNKISENNSSLMIYSGGDDALFFCPLHRVWSVMEEVEKIREQFLGKYGITCSKSIVVAHEKEPLRYVVKTSRRQIHSVKEYYGREGHKGGISLTFLYRGSGHRQVYLRQETWEGMEKLMEAFRDKKLSDSLVPALEEELPRFGQLIRLDELSELYPVISAEISRITARKCSDRLGKQEKEEIQKAMVGLFKTSSVKMVKHTYHMDFETYLNLLHIADKWARCCQNEGQKGGKK